MNTHIKTTAITLTPVLSDLINKHVSKLKHIFDGDDSVKCDIEIGRTTKHHNKGDIFQAEIHIVGHKQNVYAKSETSDLHIGIEEVFDEATRSLTSRRKKYIAMARRGGAKVKDIVKGMWPWGERPEEVSDETL